MQLHGVQVAALRAANKSRGFGFIMEQGLGKTLTSLAEMLELWADGQISFAVVICPSSFKSGWEDEIVKWGIDDRLLFHIYESGDRRNDAFHTHITNPNFDTRSCLPLLIINYEAIRSANTQAYIEACRAGRDAYIVADESIQISTHDSAQTKAAINIAKNFAYRRILSGKWMKGGPHDAWSQLRFVGGLDGFNYYSFRMRYCKMGGFKGKAVTGAKDEEGFARTIAPWVFTATKDEWTDIPAKSYTTRHYSLGPTLQRHFDSMYEDFMVFLGDGNSVAVDVAITKYMKLAQIQAGFIYDEEGKVQWLVPPAKNPRLQLLKQYLADEVTGKICIPYTHKPIFDMLYQELAEYNPAFIKGGMIPAEVQDQKRKFNGNPSCRVILLQTVASKYGHTLLGDQSEDALACRNMAFFENTYSLDDRSQIEDRIHRHGQARGVLYTDFVGTPIDKRMTEALQRKENLYQTLRKLISDRRAALVR